MSQSVCVILLRVLTISLALQCASNIRQAFTMVDILLDKGHHKELAQDLASCQDLSLKKDMVQFVSNLAVVFMVVAQHNNEGGMNISHACQKYMAAPGEPYANLVKFFKVYIRNVIDSRQIDKSTFSLCQLNRIEWLGIESK